MTQELIANMLGVRREGVTAAAGKLQKLGAIKYSRGNITVLNRPPSGGELLRMLFGSKGGNSSVAARATGSSRCRPPRFDT